MASLFLGNHVVIRVKNISNTYWPNWSYGGNGDKMKWPRRKPREIAPMNVLVHHTGLEVRHVIERRQDPLPVRAVLVYYNLNGQRYQSYPMPINGRSSIKVEVPLAFLTGRDEDLKAYGQVELILEY